MGHGIGAALLMATARAALRARAADNEKLGGLLTTVNRVLAGKSGTRQFMTMLLMRIDPAIGKAAWACAGHDPAILFDPRTDAFEELEGGDLPLGVIPDTEYESFERAPLKWGSLVFIGTDGVWESDAPSGELYGKARLREFIRANHARPLREFADKLEAELTAFRGGKGPRDDVTFVVVRLAPASGPQQTGR
jgi:sigma-B regulation protein RsbU (phosphoserine phosphatase)